jgi:hypothetical protein
MCRRQALASRISQREGPFLETAVLVAVVVVGLGVELEVP